MSNPFNNLVLFPLYSVLHCLPICSFILLHYFAFSSSSFPVTFFLSSSFFPPSFLLLFSFFSCAFSHMLSHHVYPLAYIFIFSYTSQIYDQCPMVRLQSYSPFRSPHPIRLHGFPRTDSYPSHDPGLAPQLPHGTTSAPAEQQAFKEKMDIWRDTLRKRRWMPPWPPPTETAH